MHVSLPPSISNKRVRLEIIEDEFTRFKSQESLDINLSSSLLVGVKPTYLPIVKHVPSLIPATSVPSERVFVTTVDVVTAQRASCFSKKNVNF